MIFNKVNLMNYGAYYGFNQYDFSVKDNNKNIILINGKNGSGKTTLLEAIKLALYGSFFYGLKNPNKEYFRMIEKKFNLKALKENQNQAYVELDFKWKDNNNTYNYRIKRIWTKYENIKDNFKEVVEIVKDDQNLSPKEVEDTQNYFRTIFPQKIFDFFFFDGENIKELISEEYLENNLKEAILTLFGIDIFKNLGDDLQSYLKNRSKHSNLSIEEEAFFSEQENKNNIINKIESQNTKVTKLNIYEDEYQSEIKFLNQHFKNIGGEVYNRKNKIERDILELELDRHNSTEALKSFIGNQIPFLMNFDVMKEINEQIIKEESLKDFKVINSKIKDGTLEAVIKKTFKNQNITDIEINNFYTILKDSLKNDEINLIHNLSYDEAQKIKLIKKSISKQEIEEVLKSRINNKKKLDKEKIDLNKIKHNTEIEDILKNIEQINSKIKEIIIEKTKVEEILEVEKTRLEEVEKIIKGLREKIIKSKKNNNKFNVINKVQSVLDKFIAIKNKERIEEVKKTFLKMFNSLHRKNGFIKDVEIDLETLKVKLYHEHGFLDNSYLSAGEKQIYLLSLLYSFLKVSGKEVPLIFDTLLGRLDKIHRHNVINLYLPVASKQVIMLPTDSEITGTNYSMIKKYIAREYTLNYNSEKQCVDIEVHEGEKE